MRKRALFMSTAVALGLVAGLHLAAADARAVGDPPLLVPWTRVGDIALGESKARVQSEYGSEGHGYHVVQRYQNPDDGKAVEGYYRLHGDTVAVTFYGDRVGRIGFGTPYYRTTSGFGVGSVIPLGPCHRTTNDPCEHRWHGFIWNLRLKEDPCSCWTKVGLGTRSLPATVGNFVKHPWFFIYVSRRRVSGFYFALKYAD